MIRSTIRVLIPLEKQVDALEILRPMTEQIQFEPGCVTCRIYRAVDDERAIMIEELWESDEELQRHLRSENYRNILLVVEMASESPEIHFDNITHLGGVEWIEQARIQTR